MPRSPSTVLAAARIALAKPVELDVVLSTAGQRDRANVERHLAGSDPQHVNLWQRLMRSFATLAPLSITTVGEHAIQFFIADGKYRMQVFALEDRKDGHIVVYLPDVWQEAAKLKLLPSPGKTSEGTVVYEPLDGSNTPNADRHYKNMLGWNRKAIRATLPVGVAEDEIETIEDLAALAARAWVGKIKVEEKPKAKA